MFVPFCLLANTKRHLCCRLVTFGGALYGWLSDITRIPSYVDDANHDPEYLAELARKFKKHKRV